MPDGMSDGTASTKRQVLLVAMLAPAVVLDGLWGGDLFWVALRWELFVGVMFVMERGIFAARKLPGN
jgi:hypothetical protein